MENTIAEKQREISKLNPATEKLQRELEKLQSSKKIKQDDIYSLKYQSEEAEDLIDELTTNISGLETVAEDDKRYKRINEKIEELEEHKKLLSDQLSLLIKKYYVLLMLHGINSRTKEYIEDKERKGFLPPEINKELVAMSIENCHCAVCD